MDEATAASIHATLTALSVAVGRLEEKLNGVRSDLLHHTTHEHHSFNQALAVVSEIKDDVATLQALVDQSRGAWWLLAKFGAVLVAIITIIAALWHIISGAPK
jgi:hypothetical protein